MFVQGIQCAIRQNVAVNLASDVATRASFGAYYNTVASRLELSISLMHTPTNHENRNVHKFASRKRKKRCTRKETQEKRGIVRIL